MNLSRENLITEEMVQTAVENVSLSGVTLLKISKHVDDDIGNENMVKGLLFGCLVDNSLEITNSIKETYVEDGSYNSIFRHTGLDYVHMGFYYAATKGEAMFNMNFIEEQYLHQTKTDNFVFIIYDPDMIERGILGIKAYRFSSKFMALYENTKFTFRDFSDLKMQTHDVFNELNISINNSKNVSLGIYCLERDLLNQGKLNLTNERNYVAKGQIDKEYTKIIENDETKQKSYGCGSALAEYANDSIFLDLNSNKYIKDTLEKLMSHLDDVSKSSHGFMNYHKSLQKAVINRKSQFEKCMEENRVRHLRGEQLLSEAEILKICALPPPPPQIGLVATNVQISQYVNQMNQYTKCHIKKILLSQSLLCGYNTL